MDLTWLNKYACVQDFLDLLLRRSSLLFRLFHSWSFVYIIDLRLKIFDGLVGQLAFLGQIYIVLQETEFVGVMVPNYRTLVMRLNSCLVALGKMGFELPFGRLF